MEPKYDKLQLFFDNIKAISFWQRIFSWKSLRQLSYEAYEEFKSLLASLAQSAKESAEVTHTVSSLKTDNDRLKADFQAIKPELEYTKTDLDAAHERISKLEALIASKDETIRQTEKRNTELDKELSLQKHKVDQLVNRQSELEQKNTAFKESENNRIKEYDKKMNLLTSEIERIRNERQREKEDAQQEAIEKIKEMRQMWATHQEDTKKTIKIICQKLTVEYVEKVPFKGTPDNTIEIAKEFVIFDAKSPGKDDLLNFPSYIKSQADGVKKYVNQDSVRKEVFLVIPSNTTEVIKQYTYNMGDYVVYVVTLDALEPLILSLKRIEAYEFVDQLSPEERENICRIVGKFAHIAKRRIQIDHFFAWEFLDVLTKCKAELPKEILEKVIEFEKAEKLNPPQERRAKQILTKELQSDTDKIQREAEAKAIVFPPSLQSELRTLPLYEEDKTDSSNST